VKFRKKPVVVEAVRWEFGKHIEDGWEHEDELRCALTDGMYAASRLSSDVEGWSTPTFSGGVRMYPYIDTLEGRHYISEGDWIITGIKGERYPCKGDIFAATYEEAA
jgi:hypothetical protein